MVKEEVLHVDSDGKKVILHPKLEDQEYPKVTYERYPDEKWDYLTAYQAAEKILKREDIVLSYVEEISTEMLKSVAESEDIDSFVKTDEEETDIHKQGLCTLKARVCLKGCLIGEIKLAGLTFDADLKIESATYEDSSSISIVDDLGSCVFVTANFSDLICRGNARFTGTIFFCQTSFSGAIFQKSASFIGAFFYNYIGFFNVIFSNQVSFSYATFSGETYFEFATFSGEADFNGAYLLESDFSGARFEKLLNMSEIVAGSIDFSKAIIVENVFLSSDLNRSKLEEQLELTRGELDRNKKRYNETVYYERNEEQYEKEQERLKELMEPLEVWQKSERGIYSINFEDTLIQGEFRCGFENLIPGNKKKIEPVIEPHKNEVWSKARRQYSWLKEQYRKQGEYEDEDIAHWWAMNCRTKYEMNQNKLNGVFWLLYKFIFGFGVAPGFILRSIIFVILLFTVIFRVAHLYELILPSTNQIAFNSPILDSLYFSVTTFASIGNGSQRAIGWADGCASLEGFIGFVLNAALVVVILRKMIR